MYRWMGRYVHYGRASIIRQSKSDTIKYPCYILFLVINLWSLSKFFQTWHLKGKINCSDFVMVNWARLNDTSKNPHPCMLPVYCGQSNPRFLWQIWRVELKQWSFCCLYILAVFWLVLLHETTARPETVPPSLVLLQRQQLLGQVCVFSNMKWAPQFLQKIHPIKVRATKLTFQSVLEDSSLCATAWSYSLPGYIYLPFPTACPVDLKLQHQVRCKDEEKYRDYLTKF